MNVLLFIDNNLKYDNRVKRHVNFLLDSGFHVRVIARPLPDATPGLERDNLEFVFWEPLGISLDIPVINEIADTLGVWNEFWWAYPLIDVEKSNVTSKLSYLRSHHQTLFSASYWDDFRECDFAETTDFEEEHMKMLWEIEFLLKWAEFGLQYKADIVYCNDIATLPCGVAHKRKFGSKLIFDSHEVYFDLVPKAHTKCWKNTMALLESSLARSADKVFGVSESHVELMKKIYGRYSDIHVVPNCVDSKFLIDTPSPKKYNDILRVYYHGASDRWRGLKNTVYAVSKVSNIHLILRCLASDHLEEIRLLVEELGITGRVTFLPPVEGSKVVSAVRENADIGIHVPDMPTALNIKVALTNKFIEYCLAGVPIITSPLEEQAKIVDKYDLGYVTKDNSPESIIKAFQFMLANKDKLDEMSSNSYRVGKNNYSWDRLKNDIENIINKICLN